MIGEPYSAIDEEGQRYLRRKLERETEARKAREAASASSTPTPTDERKIFEAEIVPALYGTFLGAEELDNETFKSLLERKSNGYYRNLAIASAFFGWQQRYSYSAKPAPDLEAVINKIEAKRETHRQSPAVNSWYCNNLQCQVCATFEACLSALKELLEAMK